MTKRLILLAVLLTLSGQVFAFDLDETVDDEIRKNYNTQDENLPALPAILTKPETIKQTSQTTTVSKPLPIYKGGTIKVKKGTSFEVVNNIKVNDWQGRGTRITFKTKAPIYGKKYTIPASTTFIGEIIETHQPQITCNGGLVVLRVHSMIYKGQTVPINAYITRADDKKIFLNNIKGERTYLKTMWQKGSWGRVLFGRMMNLTVNLGGEGSTFILSPFPLAYGTICLGANTLISPFCAFFSKGKHVSIPAGSRFKIKLLEDVMI